MKILYFTQFLSATGGGGEVVFCNLAKGMLRLGHEVHIICHQMTDPHSNSLDGANIYKIKPVIGHKAGYLLSSSQHVKYALNALMRGSSVIRKHKINIIHANTITPVIPASILGKIYDIPVVSTVHDVYSANSPDYWKHWSSQDKVSSTSSLIAPLYERFVLKMPVQKVHVVSNATREDVLHFNPRANISVVYNGIDLDSFLNNVKLSDYQKFVVFIGRLIITKNLQLVILAFRDVVKKIPDARLVVIGEGPMRDNWEKIASDNDLSTNVEFRGFLTEQDKKKLLSKCSALVFPSLVEGFGLVLLEAFAMAKPILGTKVKPFDEIVDEGVDGFLLPPDNPITWAEKIILLLSDKNLCQKMGQNARIKVQEKFNAQSIHSKIEQLYIELSQQKKK
jgi:glycosyltransferase involved in cell wall biosynthesis